MEKNANGSPANSPDQRQGGDSTPVASPPAADQHSDDSNTPTVIELSSSSETPPAAALESGAAEGGRPAADGSEMEMEMEVGTSSVEKKRGREDVNPAGEQMGKVAKKKGELTDIPKGEPRCATCNKVFKSWKALFGHLRSHPERTYRGALPPPTSAELNMNQTEEDHQQMRCQLQQQIEQQLASTLLSVAQVVSSRLSATASPTQRGLDIDLNQPTADEESSSRKGGLDFDLNLSPQPDSDEED